MAKPLRARGRTQAIVTGRSPVGAPQYTRASQGSGLFVRHNIWISDEAWDGIHKLMAAHGLGRNGVRRWLHYLPTDPKQYEDARPVWMIDYSIEVLAGGAETLGEPPGPFARMPIWTLELPRMPRTIWAMPEQWTILLVIARYWHISNHQRTDSIGSDISRIGALLEAIGLGHLKVKSPKAVEFDGGCAFDLS